MRVLSEISLTAGHMLSLSFNSHVVLLLGTILPLQSHVLQNVACRMAVVFMPTYLIMACILFTVLLYRSMRFLLKCKV